jgi:hypothetical protein
MKNLVNKDRKMNIETMDEWDIIDYLRFQRNIHILPLFSRDLYGKIFHREFTNDEWRDYVDFTDGLNADELCDNTEDLLEQWDEQKRKRA